MKYELFEDEALARCSRDARLLFIGLIAWSDDHGNQRTNPPLIRGRVFPYDDLTAEQIEAMLAELEEWKMVRLYEVKGERFLHICAWKKHQRIDNAGKPQVPTPEDADDADSAPVAASRGESPQAKKGPQPSAEDAPLSHLLADLIAKNDPDGVRPRPTKAWADAERLLQEKEGRDPKAIRYVIEWCQQDEFERPNVMSMTKLRKRYPSLVQKAKKAYEESKAAGAKPSTASRRVAELVDRGRKAA